jgi:hypothetical protein
MNNAWRGACLSGLVFPGLGQIVQKHYVRGLALIAAGGGSLAVVLESASRRLGALVAEIESGGGAVDLLQAVERASRHPGGEGAGAAGIASVVLLGCWVAGTLDAYYAGKRLDENGKKEELR